MLRAFFLALLSLLTTSCARHKPVIYLDHEWSLYYAKNTCYLNLPKADRDPRFDGCLARQIQGFNAFERALLPLLVAPPACADVVVSNLADVQAPPPSSGFWRLLISLDDPAGKREGWDLMRPDGPRMHHGAGDAPAIAQAVCAIASGRS